MKRNQLRRPNPIETMIRQLGFVFVFQHKGNPNKVYQKNIEDKRNSIMIPVRLSWNHKSNWILIYSNFEEGEGYSALGGLNVYRGIVMNAMFLKQVYESCFEYESKEINYQGRQSGNTTRQADALIQELFNKGEVRVRDHAHETTTDSSTMLTRIIVRRLESEHEMRRDDQYELIQNRDYSFNLKLTI